MTKEIKSLIEDLCFKLGMNQAHDWDGIESDEDALQYFKSALKQLPYKGIGDTYIVESLTHPKRKKKETRTCHLIDIFGDRPCPKVKSCNECREFY